jgi:hypothetical protein
MGRELRGESVVRYMRVEENAMDSPKFIAIGDRAWRLWCEGGTYCQKHLTDGLIPLKALRGFRYYSKAAFAELCAVNVPEKGPLWHLDGESVRVHDYLDWNDTREKVLANRKAGKDRLERWRKEQAAKRGPTPPHETRYETPRDVASKRNGTEQNKKDKSTGAARRPVENREPEEGTFGLYCVIAAEAREQSIREDHTEAVSNISEIFKTLCAKRGLAYSGDVGSKAIAAVLAKAGAA